MIEIGFSRRVQSAIINNPVGFIKKLDNLVGDVGLIVLREYKKQSPVDTGELRGRSLKVTRNKILDYSVGVPRGANRTKLQYLYEGTGRHKGKPDFGYTTGRVRASNYYGMGSRAKALKFFASLRKRGARLSIRPNKIADRATNNVKIQAISFFLRELDKLL